MAYEVINNAVTISIPVMVMGAIALALLRYSFVELRNEVERDE